jgi:hypothetical protein
MTMSSYLHDPKDPSETITVDFDYSALAVPPSNPTVSISVRWGTDAPVTLLVDGVPQIDGNVVRQRFIGGKDLTDYNLKCLADSPSGDRLSVDCVLAVRTRPV